MNNSTPVNENLAPPTGVRNDLAIQQEACVLCDNRQRWGVSVGLIRWLDPADSRRPFDAVMRCEDSAACRLRTEANGDPWPVADRPLRAAR